MPQTYIVAVAPGVVGCTDRRAESNSAGGVAVPGRVGTSCPVHASMVKRLSSPADRKRAA